MLKEAEIPVGQEMAQSSTRRGWVEVDDNGDPIKPIVGTPKTRFYNQKGGQWVVPISIVRFGPFAGENYTTKGS